MLECCLKFLTFLNRYSLEKTVAVLQSTYNISPAPAAHDMEEAMVKEAEEISKKDFAQLYSEEELIPDKMRLFMSYFLMYC